MNFKKIFAIVVVVFASFIQVGCGNSNPNANTLGINQQGTYVPGATNTASCTSGPTYPMGTYGCAPGYVMQNNMCTCQATITGTGTTTTASSQCQSPGYLYVNYPQYGVMGCYMQGQCQAGYAFVTHTGYCFRVQQ